MFCCLTKIRGRAADVGSGKEKRFGNVGEVVFFFHTLHQNRADHTAPADETYFHVLLLNKENPDKFYSALTKTGTASPATLFRFLLTHYKKGENKCF